MNSVLVVPVQLDALVLEDDRLMVEAMADFSRLPYVDRGLKREVNADNANISETIVSQPFHSQNLQLKAGLHLHWAMPDALTRGVHERSGTRFPPLPNRWLVTRSRDGAARKSWVIESDYVFPLPRKTDPAYQDYVSQAFDQIGAISYLYREIDRESDEPFRFVGRQLLLEDWLTPGIDSGAEHFPTDQPLTAVGYGDIAFAAFYPNCHSVFGFHDHDLKEAKDIAGHRYEIFGWHSAETHDPVKRLLLGEAILNAFSVKAPVAEREAHALDSKSNFLNLFGSASSGEIASLTAIIDGLIQGDSLRGELRDFLARQSEQTISAMFARLVDAGYSGELGSIDRLGDFKWALRRNDPENIPEKSVPERAIYYSSMSFSTESKTADIAGPVTIAIGNTTMEALSAYLARRLAGDFGIEIGAKTGPEREEGRKRIERLEDQLESLHLFGKTSNRKLDIGAKLREARHDSGFTPIAGGLRWAVRLQSPPPRSSSEQASLVKGGGEPGASHSPNAGHAQSQRRVILPPEMTALLAELNNRQDEINSKVVEIGARQKQLFSDWYKYMLSAYHPADAVRGDDYPNVDEVRFFIEENDIAPFEEAAQPIEGMQASFDAAREQLQRLIAHYNNSLLVHIRPPVPDINVAFGQPAGVDDASFADRIEHNLQFAEATQAGGNENPDFATSLSFDGKTSFARLRWQMPPPQAHRGVTLSAWINADLGVTSARAVFAIGELVLHVSPLQRGANVRLAVGCRGVDERIGVISPGRWHHLAVTCEDRDTPVETRLIVYIDGQQFSLDGANGIGLHSFDRLCIGQADNPGVDGFLGRMTQIRFDNRVLTPVEVRRDMNNGSRPAYQLYNKAAPRYWQPNEPVVLLVGNGIRATERHGQYGRLRGDGALECIVTEALPQALEDLLTGGRGQSKTDIDSAVAGISTSVGIALNNTSSKEIACSEWSGQPWHPIMLEWEVLLQPARGEHSIEGAGFEPDVITANYDLPDNAVDLRVKEDRKQLADGTVYSNRCYLTPHSGALLLARIGDALKSFLEHLTETIRQFDEQEKNEKLPVKEAINSYHRTIKGWSLERPMPVFSADGALQLDKPFLEKLKIWYQDKPTYRGSVEQTFAALAKPAKADDPIYIAICAGCELYDDDGKPLTFMSQSLGGFNDELLMHKRMMQLPVADPLGFEDCQQFTDRVASLLRGRTHSAPVPTNQFSPIRTGALEITRLRLIDSFGQIKDFNREAILAAGHEIITPQRLSVPDSPHLAWLPPRLVQPARIDFRWLRSDEDDHDSTPVCGWVLPNNLQKTLAVYDHRGLGLGSILRRGTSIQWEPAPGRNTEAGEIENPHLKRVVAHILGKNDSNDAVNFLDDFLTAVESALETIDPEGHAQHQSLALLIGRPIAVVRAALNLELQGLPAVNQSWHAFQADLRRDRRETDDFTAVDFPVRIGEYHQLNDGVVGYWIEEKTDGCGDAYRYRKDQHSKGKDATFYAPQTPNSSINKRIDHPDIHIHRPGRPVQILHRIDSPSLHATLLFDPRGKVHLTSGVLPTKVIDIPAEEYAEALEAIQVNFLTAPILTAHGTRSVPVPHESGFSWAWMEHERWLEKAVLAERLGVEADDADLLELWTTLVGCGWIQPIGADRDRARIVPMGRRASEELAGLFDTSEERTEFEDRLERLFWGKYGSTPVMERETFLNRLQKLSGVSDHSLLQSVWNQLLKEEIRWLSAIPSDPTRARVLPIDERLAAHLELPAQWIIALREAAPPIGGAEPAALMGKWVERILNTKALELSPVETQARFDAEQEIREGWLVLRNEREET